LNDRAPGYGIVSFRRSTRTIEIANWPRWVDPSQPGAAPYEGWPITIHQLDNGFPHDGLSLGKIEVGHDNAVVQVFDSSGALVYALRPSVRTFELKVREPGEYSVLLLDPDGAYRKRIDGLEARR
jgi:hypothetical protein